MFATSDGTLDQAREIRRGSSRRELCTLGVDARLKPLDGQHFDQLEEVRAEAALTFRRARYPSHLIAVPRS